MSDVADKEGSPTRTKCKHCLAEFSSIDDLFCCAGCAAAFIAQKVLNGDCRGQSSVEQPTSNKTMDIASDSAFTGYNEKVSKLDPAALNVNFEISGIHCAGCVWLLESLPEKTPGLLRVRVNLSLGAIEFDYLPSILNLSDLFKLIAAMGYQLVTPAGSKKNLEKTLSLARLGIAGFSTMNTMMLAVSLFQGFYTGIDENIAQVFRWVSLILTLPVVTFCAWPFYRNSLTGLRARKVHIDFPLSIAIVAAFLLSAWNTVAHYEYVYFDSVCALVFLLLCGRAIQSWALEKARAETDISWSLIPNLARRVDVSGETLVETSLLKAGDSVRVLVFERFPVDGEVLIGRSAIDNSALTGESLPQPVETGSAVNAGTLNTEADLLVRVTHAGSSTRIGRILKQLAVQGRPAWGLSAFVDLASGWFTVVVLQLAFLGGVFWLSNGFERALEVAITFLIVSCPCALGIATPLVLAISLSRASRRGIFIRSVESLERLVQAENIFFDKTGTVTEGNFDVVKFHYLPTVDRDEVLQLLLVRSAHPVAKAVANFAKSQLNASEDITLQSRSIPSCGLEILREGEVAGRLGSERWFKELGQECDATLRNALTQSHASLDSLVYFSGSSGEICAVFQLSDKVKFGAAEFIKKLNRNEKKLFLLSGDRIPTVSFVGEQLGFAQENVFGECSPEDKAHKVSIHHNACFIGDGINDTLAMRAAGVSIGVSGGLKTTLEVADIFISSGNIEDLNQLFAGAQLTMRVIKRNLFFSIFYNVVGGGLALSGLMNPLIAALLMPASSLTVIAHSLISKTFEGRATQNLPNSGESKWK